MTLSEPEAAEEDEGSTEGKGAAVKAEELGSHSQMEEPPAWGVPRPLAQLPQLCAHAFGACPPGAPLSRVTSLSERITSLISTQKRYINTRCPATYEPCLISGALIHNKHGSVKRVAVRE